MPPPEEASTSRLPSLILFHHPAIPDPYPAALPQYETTSIPVLTETYHPSNLALHLDTCSGVIITSKRGAESYILAAHQRASAPQLSSSQRPNGRGIPLYAVGQTTVDILASASLGPFKLDTTHPAAASAKQLIPILTSLSPNTPLLLVRGDKSLDVLPSALRAHSIPFTEVHAYSTTESAGLRDRIREAWRGVEWVVFLAPSSAGMVIPHLLDEGVSLPRLEAGLLGADIRIAAIGETTRRYLEKQGWRVDAIASQPTAEGLAIAVREADSAVHALEPP